MTGSNLLLMFSLLTGLIAEQCDITSADIEAFYERVTVTNASTESGALVGVALDHSSVTWFLPAGTSHTATGVLSTKFTVYVKAPTSALYIGYRQLLQDTRNKLVNLSLDPGSSPEQVTTAATDLLVVVAAQQQLGVESDDVQSCSGTIKPSVESQATVGYTKTSDGAEVWSVDCS